MEIWCHDRVHRQGSLAIHVCIAESLLVDTHSWFYLFIISHADAKVLVALPQHFRPVVTPGIERATIIKDNSFYI